MHNTSTEYKQIHNKTISWNDNWILIFICFVGRLLLEPSTSSSSSFIIASFLIQILRWIRCSSRVQIFIFLIIWGIFFGWWELDLQFLPSYDSSFLFFLESAKSNHTFLEWMNPMILGGYSRWLSPLLHSSLSLQVVLWFEIPLWLHGFCILDLHILQLVS